MKLADLKIRGKRFFPEDLESALMTGHLMMLNDDK